MKKFSKILTLLLALVTVFTAFTVVALANEEPVKEPPFTFLNYLFDNREVGYVGDEANNETDNPTATDKYNGKGYYGVAEFPYGNGTLNKYMVSFAEPAVNKADGTKPGESYFGMGYNSNRTKELGTYPYVAVDFDVMKPTEDYYNNSFGAYVYYAYLKANGKDYDYNKPWHASFSLSSIFDALPTNTYEWAHVTLIYKLENIKDAYYIGVYAYVNGDLEYSSPMHVSLPSPYTGEDGATYTPEQFFIGEIRLSHNYSDDDPEGKIRTGYDNIKFNYYTADYTRDEVASYVYNDSYEMPFSRTVATIGETQYDDIYDAIEAAGEGDVIKLTEAIEEAVVVNKAVVIDTAGFAFEYTSTEGYSATVDGDVYTFAVDENVVTVKWDALCAEDCDCNSAVGGHILASETVVALGSVPSYDGVIPEFGLNGRTLINFLGWSYENDGTADTLREVTADDVLLGTINLYPIYEVIVYSYEVTAANGDVTYFTEDDYMNVFKSSAGSTIKLLDDVDVLEQIGNDGKDGRIGHILSKNITLDLNGYTLHRYYTVVSKYQASYDEATGTYTKGDLIETVTTGNGGYVFYVSNLIGNFTLKSSRPGAYLINSGKITADQLIYDGKVVETTVTSNGSYGGLFSCYPAQDAFFNFYGENITYYGGTMFYGEHGSNGTDNRNFVVNIDGGTYVFPIKASEGALAIRQGKTHTVKNAKFVFLVNSTYLVSGGNKNKTTTVNFENCDIINGNIDIRVATYTVNFTNCRANISSVNSYLHAGDVFVGDDTLVTSKAARTDVAAGCQYEENTVKKTFTYPTLSAVNFGEEVEGVVFKEASKSITFKYEVMDLEKDYTDVSWIDVNGKVITSAPVIKNTTVTAPVTYGRSDGYIAAKVTEWTDEEGKVSNLFVGEEENYVFTAKDPVLNENTEYKAAIAGAQFNFIYYGQFHTVLYLPVDERVESPKASGFIDSYYKVKINGKDYWAFTKYCSTTGVSDDVTTAVTFTIDGVDYTQNFKLSALNYAKAILSDPINDIEAKAVANMVRYVKEARLAAGLEIGEQFGEVEALYALGDYKAAAEYDDLGADYTSISDYVDSINFMIDGNSASYVFTLNEKYAENATIAVKFSDGWNVELRKSTTHANSYYSTNTRVYNLIKGIIVTVTVPAAEEGGEATVVTGTYSIGAYIQATDNALSKAMYEFGIAAADYRAYLISKA